MPETPSATLTSPSRHGRPKVSETITATRTRRASSRPARILFADASGSLGSRVTQFSTTLEVSTPALAQMNPWAVSEISTPRSIRTIRFDSRNTTSTTRGSLSKAAAQSRARGDGSIESRFTARPSAFEMIFCATTKTSRSTTSILASRRAAAISAATSSPPVTSGIPDTPTSSMFLVTTFLRLCVFASLRLCDFARGHSAHSEAKLLQISFSPQACFFQFESFENAHLIQRGKRFGAFTVFEQRLDVCRLVDVQRDASVLHYHAFDTDTGSFLLMER